MGCYERDCLKIKVQNKKFSNRIMIDKEEIYDQKTIAPALNEFCIHIGPKLAKANSKSKSTIWKLYTIQRAEFHGSELTDEEL